MKRLSILCLTAFYLLLSSGMFVCVVHCTSEKLFAKPNMQMACTGHPSKKCSGGKENDCCKKHPNFIIRENFNPAHDIHFALASVTLPQIQLPGVLLNDLAWHNSIVPTGNAPPGVSGKTISITFHSLLI